jgi:hypothetical protein
MKLNKKEIIEDMLQRIYENVECDYDPSEKEMKTFRKEAKKIVTEYVKTYSYDEDIDGGECVDDWDFFEGNLFKRLCIRTTGFLHEAYKERLEAFT